MPKTTVVPNYIQWHIVMEKRGNSFFFFLGLHLPVRISAHFLKYFGGYIRQSNLESR